MQFHRPSDLAEALDVLADGEVTILAGGTDLYPATETQTLTGSVLDITGIAALSGIADTADGLRIGAATTWSALIRHDLPPAFDALKAAAREVGSVQIQNAATLAGNLCNASPAADGVPPLLVLDAELELASRGGMRRVPLAEFIAGNRQTARARDEVVTAIHVPKTALSGNSGFRKLGARRYLVISIAMVAARVELDPDGIIRAAALAVGACAPRAVRLGDAEAWLLGKPAGAVPPADLVTAPLSPIDDVRASAAYRIGAAQDLVASALMDAFGQAGRA